MEAIQLEVERRVRKASKARRDLQKTVTQLDALLPSLSDKPTKQADILCEKASAVKTLLNLESEERKTETDIRLKRLETERETQGRRVTELEQQNKQLRDELLTKRLEAMSMNRITVPDPNHVATKEERDSLQMVIRTLTSGMTEETKADAAVRLFEVSSKAAEIFCRLILLDYGDLMRMMGRTEADLRHLKDARNATGVLVRAILKVKCVSLPKAKATEILIPNNRSAEEKIRDAKALTKAISMSPKFRIRQFESMADSS